MKSSTKKHLGPMDKPEFGRTAGDYAAHRAGFPPSLFERLKPFGIGLEGQRILDLGTGTGTLARGFAARGGDVTGLDLDTEMLVEARRLAAKDGVPIEFREGRAEATGLEPGFFDVVSAGQCWHWFEARPALDEIMRVLKKQGTLLIAHFDWLSLNGNVAEMTEALILEHSPSWKGAGGMGLYPYWLKQLGDYGFEDLETFSYDVMQPYSKQAWRGRIQACAGIASLESKSRADFDLALAKALEKVEKGDQLVVPHRVFALIAPRPDQF